MGKLADIIRKNRLYTVLAIFVVAVNLIALAGSMVERSAEGERKATEAGEIAGEPDDKKTFFDEEDIRKKQERFNVLAAEDPTLYLFLAIVNMLILFIIVVGLILDIYFLVRWFRKEPVRIRIIQPETPRWSIADIVRVTLIFLSCGYVFVIVQGFLLRLFPILNNENFRMVLSTAVINVVGISVILYFIVKKYGQDVSAVGLTGKNFSAGVFYAVVGYVSLVPVLLLIMIMTFFVTGWLKYQPPVQTIVRVFIEEKETSVLWFSASFAAVFGPVAEEIFFRGFMYSAVRKKMGIFWGIVITSAVFSFLHTHIVGFLPIMMLGMLLAYLYEKTGSLVAPISVHIIHNLGMVVLVFLMRSLGA